MNSEIKRPLLGGFKPVVSYETKSPVVEFWRCPKNDCMAPGFSTTVCTQDPTDEDPSPYYKPEGYIECWNCSSKAICTKIPTCLKNHQIIDGRVDTGFFPTHDKFVKQWEDGNYDLPKWLCDPMTRVFKTVPADFKIPDN
jgi:hypothetical protein